MKSEKNAQFFSKILSLFSILLFLLLPTAVTGKCDCNISDKKGKSQSLLIKYKLAAIGSILTAGGVGVSIPLVGRRIKVLRPENDIFFMIKAFAAGVILATGFIHILPDAFRVLNSPCLDRFPWTEFPFAGMVAMAAAIATLMIDTWATSFFNKKHLMSPKQVDNADEESLEVAIVNSHDSATATATATATASSSSTASDLLRQRIISQVLELGIVVHSLVIGITMGTSQNVATIKPLLIALSFHQFFEGMGLGGCISQAQFKSVSTTVMAVFFSLTAPVGIGIGIGISSSYKQGSSSTTASSGGGGLIVEGILESASAGILIYTALVDLLAADFMNTRMQNNTRLLLGAQVSLLLGAGCMSILARWA